MLPKRVAANKGGILLAALVVAGVIAGMIAAVVVLQNYSSSENDDEKAQAVSGDDTGSSTLMPLMTTTADSPDVTVDERINCFPEALGGVETMNEEKCMSRGCVYKDASCFFPQTNFGYKVVEREVTRLGFQLTLRREGTFPFGGDIETIVFRVEELGDGLLRFTIDDPATQRYKVPVPLDLPDEKADNPMYEVVITNENPFSFQVIRRSTKTVIWDTGVGGFVFSDQFIQIATKLPSKNVYGFGENLHYSFRHDMNHKTWPMFARDQGPKQKNQSSLYSVHPFYQCVEGDGNTHGVFLLNSNAQEYGFTPLPMLTYRTIGGILDFYIFMGPKPEDVVIQYTNVVGRPIMPPYWALGFQLCRFGYNSLENLKAAVNRTKAAEIPYDVQYADIDHMENQKDFTIGESFDGLPEYFRGLRNQGMKTIIILDPALISNETNYEPYEKMKAIDGNIKWPRDFTPPPQSNDSNSAILGYVWPVGKVVFPDFFKKSTNDVWKKLIEDHHKVLPFDGLWIDMNEPANFGTNEDRPWNWPKDVKPYWSLKCGNNSFDEPPYRPMCAFIHDDGEKSIMKLLSDKTICMNTVQGESGMYRHYDVHSLYGWSQTSSTLEALKEATGKRGIVISRSTYAGSGRYAGHWLGDNDSQWPDLHHSIIGMLEFNLFGIPYIGADICGFFGDATPEMCKRWMQLGAFYTFSRNHNDKGNIDQDPGMFDEDVVKASKEALETRYWLLPYLYTLFHNAHVHGHTVIRPLHHEFPSDQIALGIDRQFLWGSALLISPILEMGQTKLSLYLPRAKWYNFYTGALDSEEGEETLELNIKADSKIPLHVRGGSILPMQKPSNNTYFSRMNPMTLLVAFDKDASAEGEIMWDDGEEINTYESGNNYYAKFAARRNMVVLINVWRKNVPEIDNLHFDTIKIFGVDEVSYIYINDDKTPHENFTFNEDKKVLIIHNLHLPLAENFKVTWDSGIRVKESDSKRVDCLPDIIHEDKRLAANDTCLSRGCVWDPSPNNIQVPPCYFSFGYGYTLIANATTNMGVKYTLTKVGDHTIFGGDISNIIMEVKMYSNDMMRFTFDTQNSSERFKVPINLKLPDVSTKDKRYEFIVTNNNPFSFEIIRKSTGTKIWDTSVGGLTFAEQFLQIATRLPSRNIYGMGENRHKSFRHDVFFRRWGLFSRDQPPGWGENINLYGVHPFYTCVEDENNAHGVLLLNSNAQDYSFSPLPMLTYRTIGGILDFFVFMGPHPENVVQQYTQLIGRPMMPPYWSLGFQLCRYGYNHIDNLRAAVERTVLAKIPLDVQYADIDHMDERKDFTIDGTNFANLDKYFKKLQDSGMRIIIILDPALISNVTDYVPYEAMAAQDANIKWPQFDDNNNPFVAPENSSDSNGAVLGYVWPKGKTVFPDFFKNETKQIWKALIVDHYNNNLTFDGLWIDMNEPANFGTNEEKPFNWPKKDKPYWSLKCNESKWDKPPYKTMATYAHGEKATLPDKTICMNSVQGPNGMYRHYDVHSLYGWSQTLPTLEGLQQATGERGIVISRSTFPGSGKYAGHWLGDNDSNWSHLADSIIGMLEFNLFGIPYIGADICGFFGDATPEMCKRWMQLGAFYTFSRNHNGLEGRNQDPASLGEDVAEASRIAIETRYCLLPYLYTLFHYAHFQGDTVIRPLHHEFIWDTETYGIDRQFLWGPALLISPILEEAQEKLSVYLPLKARWYDFYTGQIATEWGGHSVELRIEPDSKIPLHLRGGYILPMQEPANNTYYSRMKPFKLRVALDAWSTKGGKAEGDLFWDDGVSIDTMSNIYYTKFFASEMMVEMKVQDNSSVVEGLFINSIEIYGVDNYVNNVYIRVHNDMMDKMMKHNKFLYDPENKVLIITSLHLNLNMDFSVEFWNRDKPSAEETMRIDCLPDSRKFQDYQSECLRRDCKWQADTTANGVPACFIDNNNYGYTLHNVTHPSATRTVFDLRKAHTLGYSMFGGDRLIVHLTVDMLSDKLIRFKFTDPSDPYRYEVPVPLYLPQPQGTQNQLYEVNYTSDGIFSFHVSRRSTGTILFDTSIGGLTFASQFLQLVTKLPSSNVYGFGENRHFSFRHNMYYKEWPMFARDQGVGHNDYGNLYGVHPFFTCLEDEEGNAFGVFIRNSNAQEVSLMPTPAINYRTTGGILDFFIFLGPSPENVIQQYTELIGRPFMPPYWSLGFQLCRYGYNHLDALKAAYQRTIDAKIPLDVQYADIDHMDERMDFTIDPVNFAGLPEFVSSIQDAGTRFIIILDPALISNVTGYKPYEKGLEQDIYIKWPPGLSPDYAEYNNNNMLGYVWPKGKTVFPDFLHNNTHRYWEDLIVDWYRNITFDGLWIDMNEPANFETNEERPWNWPEKDRPYWSLKCATNQWDDPPYKPRSITGDRLSEKTLCMIGVQRIGNMEYRHYDVHSLYGWSETKPTLNGLQAATGKRGIVISRSTFPGSGKDGGHWLGDNDSLWSHMKDSIVGMLEFNMFGIPYVGADICGFGRDTTKEMCQRWMQIGAFYPFSRNHNAIGQKDQDPGILGREVADSSRKAMEIRYWLLPYLYTLFYKANTKGSTVVRSLMHQYPTDKNTWDIDTQFLWGADFMVAPIVHEAKMSRTVYFPKDVWYDFHTGKRLMVMGYYWPVIAPMDHIPLYIRGGAILPGQQPANNTKFSRLNPLELLVAPDEMGKADGDLFWDDGDSRDTIQTGQFFFATFAYRRQTTTYTLTSAIQDNGYSPGLTINRVKVFGVDTQPGSILSSGQGHTDFMYFSDTKTLVIDDLQLSVNNTIQIDIQL